ncbi:MAG: hypothetical protein JJ936_15405, partial [Psychroserpens sp.]|nr:hypothetical protein [Psychroserpens sp.]
MKLKLFSFSTILVVLFCYNVNTRHTNLSLCSSKNADASHLNGDSLIQWKIYKDSLLVLESSSLDKSLLTLKINKNESFENLIFHIAYESNDKRITRKIQLLDLKKTFATFVDEKPTGAPFYIDKFTLDRIPMGTVLREFDVQYTDANHKNGII